MARIIVWNLVTLDRFFEGKTPWEIDWHPWGDELEKLSLDQLHSAGGLVFGRKTYQGMAEYWKTATGEIADLMNTLPKAVVSRSLKTADWPNTRVLAGPEEVGLWKKDTKKDLYAFGSADLIDSLMTAGLVDEFRLGLVPLVLGGGTPHFKPHPAQQKMALLEAKKLGQDMVLLRYEVKKREQGSPNFEVLRT